MKAKRYELRDEQWEQIKEMSPKLKQTHSVFFVLSFNISSEVQKKSI